MSATLVVAALREELGGVRRRMRRLPGASGRRDGRRSGVRVRHGLLGGLPVAAAVTGDGGARAGRVTARLLDELRPRRLLLLGVAGGLDPRLQAGEVVAGSEVRDGETRLPAEEEALAAAWRAGLQAGVVVTAPELVGEPEGKAELWRAVGRPARAVVDLESGAVVRAAREAGVPWLVVRAVADVADEALPASLVRFSEREGPARRARVVAEALLHPRTLPVLLRLAFRVRAASRRLGEAASLILAAWETPEGPSPTVTRGSERG